MKKCLAFLALACMVTVAVSQSVIWQPEAIQALTPEWNGERYPDGRPKVPDDILERLKPAVMEDIWSFLRRYGYNNQFENFSSLYENGWTIVHPDRVMTGRVLTAQFIPSRPDFKEYVEKQAEKEGTHTPVTNYAPIIKLQEGDVYVADAYGKIIDGTLIGGNLGDAIANSSKRGIIFNGSVRDLAEISKIGEDFNGWIRGHDVSGIREMMIAWINAPIRIGRAAVLPGDVVLANKYGVTFIPAHLAEEAALSSEYTSLRNQFQIHCRETNKFEYINEHFVVEREVYEKAFLGWIDENPHLLPMPEQEILDYHNKLQERRKRN